MHARQRQRRVLPRRRATRRIGCANDRTRQRTRASVSRLQCKRAKCRDVDKAGSTPADGDDVSRRMLAPK